MLVDFESENAGQPQKVWFLARVRCFYILVLDQPFRAEEADEPEAPAQDKVFRLALLDQIFGKSPGRNRGTAPLPGSPGLVKVQRHSAAPADLPRGPMLYQLDSIQEKVCVAMEADASEYLYYMRYMKSYRLGQ